MAVYTHSATLISTIISECDDNGDSQYAIKLVEYINRRNREIRAEWLAKVNVGNVFLERYMKRRMHPDNFKALIADPDIDVDAFMEAYVATL